MRIRWIRIKKLTNAVAERSIDIHLSTALKQLVAFLSDDDGQLAILLNATLCKTESDIAVAISHELSHAKFQNDLHDEAFEIEFDRVLNLFQKSLNVSDGEIEFSKEKLGR